MRSRDGWDVLAVDLDPDRDAAGEAFAADLVLKRLLEPAEVAEAVAFLLGPGAPRLPARRS